MAKSLRSKREKRLRAIRREIVEPLYEKKDAAKLAAQEAALAAPKLPVRNSIINSSMDVTSSLQPSSSSSAMDVDMADRGQGAGNLKPVGGVGKKLIKKLKLGKGKQGSKGKGKGKGKIRRTHI